MANRNGEKAAKQAKKKKGGLTVLSVLWESSW